MEPQGKAFLGMNSGATESCVHLVWWRAALRRPLLGHRALQRRKKRRRLLQRKAVETQAKGTVLRKKRQWFHLQRRFYRPAAGVGRRPPRAALPSWPASCRPPPRRQPRLQTRKAVNRCADVGCRLSAVWLQPSANSCRLSAVGGWLVAVGDRTLATSPWPATNHCLLQLERAGYGQTTG